MSAHPASGPEVVVVGSGVAGLCAALSAAQAGARVTLLDRATEAEAGGNTRYTEAYLRMKSVDEVSDDLPRRLLDDVAGHPDPGIALEQLGPQERWSALARVLDVPSSDMVDTLCREAGPTLRWIERHGVRFDALPTAFLTTSTTRLMPVGGGLALVEALRAAGRTAGVRMCWESTARALVRDGAGAVTGVRARVRGAGEQEFPGAVVLACGGFEGSTEVLARYLGGKAHECRPVARGGHYNKGEGLLMALDAGAAGAGNYGMFHAEPVDPRSGAAEAAIFGFPYGVLVNTEGERFTDEGPGRVDSWYETITRRIHAQPGGITYAVFDARTADVPKFGSSIRTDQPAISAGSPEELGAALGLPSGALPATLARYNAACREGQFRPLKTDGLATEGISPPKSNWARPVDSAPLFAYPMIASNVFTFGGLRTGVRAEVLDTDGEPIPGLYAAGELTGLYYTNYTGSSSVLRGAVFGRIAGAEAAGGTDAAHTSPGRATVSRVG